MGQFLLFFLRGLIIFGLGTASGVLSKQAFAHGDASWIMEDEKTAPCCGPDDCFKLAVGNVIRVKTGVWYVPETKQYFKQGDANVHPSKTGEFWACYGISEEGRYVRCLFYPAEIF